MGPENLTGTETGIETGTKNNIFDVLKTKIVVILNKLSSNKITFSQKFIDSKDYEGFTKSSEFGDLIDLIYSRSETNYKGLTISHFIDEEDFGYIIDKMNGEIAKEHGSNRDFNKKAKEHIDNEFLEGLIDYLITNKEKFIKKHQN